MPGSLEKTLRAGLEKAEDLCGGNGFLAQNCRAAFRRIGRMTDAAGEAFASREMRGRVADLLREVVDQSGPSFVADELEEIVGTIEQAPVIA